MQNSTQRERPSLMLLFVQTYPLDGEFSQAKDQEVVDLPSSRRNPMCHIDGWLLSK